MEPAMKINCDLCSASLYRRPFVDCKILAGPWANICLHCYLIHGLHPFGIGRATLFDSAGLRVAHAQANNPTIFAEIQRSAESVIL